MRIFFRAIVIHIILNAYVFWKGWNVIPSKKYYRIAYVAVFLIEFLIYFTAFSTFDKLPINLMHFGVWIGSSWMLFIIYMSVPLLLYDLLKWTNRKWGFLPDKIDLNRFKLRAGYYFACLSLVVSSMIYGNYKFKNPSANYLSLDVEKKSISIDSLRVVVVSDLHVGFLIDKPILKNYVELIMRQNADLILLVGDIIDYDLQSVKEQNMHEEFQKLKAPYGVFASTGNHEYINVNNDLEEKLAWLRDETGMTWLRDSVACVDSLFYVIGREDNKFEARKTAVELTTDLDKTKPIIIMNHQPHKSNLEDDVAAGANLAVYGHTHDGQVFPANILVSLMYEKSSGYMKKGNSHIYVSSGLGLAGPQYRIATESEVVVIDLKFVKF